MEPGKPRLDPPLRHIPVNHLKRALSRTSTRSTPSAKPARPSSGVRPEKAGDSSRPPMTTAASRVGTWR
jgi:hypothetical protein